MNRRCILTSCWYHKKQNRLVKHVKRFPLLHNIYNNSFNPKKEGKKNKDIKDLYGKNIEGFKKVLYEKSMNFVFITNVKRLKM